MLRWGVLVQGVTWLLRDFALHGARGHDVAEAPVCCGPNPPGLSSLTEVSWVRGKRALKRCAAA